MPRQEKVEIPPDPIDPIGTGTSKWFHQSSLATAPSALGGLFKVYKGGARQAWEVPMGELVASGHHQHQPSLIIKYRESYQKKL